MNAKQASPRKEKSSRSAAVLPLGILFAMLGIAGGVVIWLTYTTEPANVNGDIKGPRAVVVLSPSIKNKSVRGHAKKDTQHGAAGKQPNAKAPITNPKPQSGGDKGSAQKSDDTANNPQSSTQPLTPGQPSLPAQVAVEPIENLITEEVPGQLQLPTLKFAKSLISAPDPGLIQDSGLGPLPMISSDGRQPWRVYARPFDRSNKKPRIAIVITGLGLSSAATNIAIQSLPGSITLAFAPYATRPGEWIKLARIAGHEVLLNVPMEPVNYPAYDPGPQTLLTTLSEKQNVDRLLWTLSRATGYVGVADFMGSRFTTSRKHLRPILKMLNKRGLLFLNSKTAARSLAPVLAGDIGIPFAINSLFIDELASRFAIDKQLVLLEAAAKEQKMVIAMGSPYPVTLERISNWVKNIERLGFVQAPVSSMVKRK